MWMSQSVSTKNQANNIDNNKNPNQTSSYLRLHKVAQISLCSSFGYICVGNETRLVKPGEDKYKLRLSMRSIGFTLHMRICHSDIPSGRTRRWQPTLGLEL